MDAVLFPLDKQLHLSDSVYSDGMARQMVWLSGLLTYQQSAEVFERIGAVLVGSSSIWRQTQRHGQRLLEQADHARQQVSVERVSLSMTDHATQKGISMDGGMVNLREEGWKEMKVGIVFDVQQRLERDVRSGEWLDQAHAVHPTYTAVVGDTSAFAPALWQVAVAADVPSAATSSVTADGAEWIWNLSADLFPDSVQIVDWFHATQHLHSAAEALFPNQPDQQTRWQQQRTDDLFMGNIHCITQPLDAAGLSDFSHYFHNHQRRMQYLEFRENGLPIGSGTVESGVKQFKTRLTGAGMRWSRPAAQAMLVIRAAVMNHSFDALWSHAA